MAKKMTKAESQAIIWLFIIGAPVYGVMKLNESGGLIPFLVFFSIVVTVLVIIKAVRRKRRYNRLMEKYQNSGLVEKLMNRGFWQNQTAGQLLDSLGKPHDIDRKVLKTKKKEVWKYNHQGGN